MAHRSVSHHLVCLCCYWVEGIFKLAYFSLSFLLGQRWNQVYLKHGCSVTSNSLKLHGLQPARLPYPWSFSGENTGVGCYFLFQGIFPTLGIQSESFASPALAVRFFTLSHQGSLFETWYNLNISFPSILNRSWIAFYPLGLTLLSTIIKINYNLIGRRMKIDFSYNATVCNYQWC